MNTVIKLHGLWYTSIAGKLSELPYYGYLSASNSIGDYLIVSNDDGDWYVRDYKTNTLLSHVYKSSSEAIDTVKQYRSGFGIDMMYVPNDTVEVDDKLPLYWIKYGSIARSCNPKDIDNSLLLETMIRDGLEIHNDIAIIQDGMVIEIY